MVHLRMRIQLQQVDDCGNIIGDVINNMKQFRLGKKLQGLSIRKMIEDGRD